MSMPDRIIREGWDVYTADDKEVGKAREHHADYLHVHHGRLFGKDEYYFPSWTVGRIDESAGRAYLTLTKDGREGQDWSTKPRPGETREQRFGTAATAAAQTARMDATGRAGATQAQGKVETLDQREVVVPVVEERLDVTKRPVELGEVVINREVVEREETVPVEVAHEEVRIERRSAGREATPEDLRMAAGEGLAALEAGGQVVVPVIEEVVEVRKRMMVREELVISKQRVTERHEVTERVRRVEPRVESTGRLERDVEATAAGARTAGMAGDATGRTGTAGMPAAGADRGERDTAGRNPLERAADAVRDKVDEARDRP